MKTKLLKNKEMSSDVYALRRQVINLIHEAKKLVELPRINVRVTDKHDTILGVAKMGKNIIWITEETVASRAVVFHEILHAVFGQDHVKGCPLMAAQISTKLDVKTCDELFIKYAKRQARKEIARIVKEELPKVKTKVSSKKCGAGYLIVKASKKDEELSKKLSTKIANLMKVGAA